MKILSLYVNKYKKYKEFIMVYKKDIDIDTHRHNLQDQFYLVLKSHFLVR